MPVHLQSNGRSLRRCPLGQRGLKLQLHLKQLLFFGRCPLGQRGLKCVHDRLRDPNASRCPLGQRGLKWVLVIWTAKNAKSLPTWAAWIEIVTTKYHKALTTRRCPLGQRGLKYS